MLQWLLLDNLITSCLMIFAALVWYDLMIRFEHRKGFLCLLVVNIILVACNLMFAFLACQKMLEIRVISPSGLFRAVNWFQYIALLLQVFGIIWIRHPLGKLLEDGEQSL